jgi:Mg-chelatase subunit ChlD
MTWAAKRQITYFSVFMALIIIVVGIPAFALLYQKPTCFDNKMNGIEQGVDCGGICSRLCPAYVTKPVVVWQQAFKVEPGLYSAVAYVQNPNLNAQAVHVPYTFTFRNEANAVVLERKGTAFIPAGKNFAIFESNIVVPKDIGTLRTTFAFTDAFDWHNATSPQLSIANQIVDGVSNAPKISADIVNPNRTDFGRVNVTAIVYDTEGNAVAASRTYLDSLTRESKAQVVFTWPEPFSGQVTSCQQPTDIVLAIDRSGSMASDSKNPPEPLTSVKNAALSFVNQLSVKDKSSVISFATEASNPIDQVLTLDKARIREAIDAIAIDAAGLQYTNIADALKKAIEEFSTTRHQTTAKKAIVLLTDGEPTHPQKTGDANYPKDVALAAARDAQSRGIELYTIGLGQETDESFLKALAGIDERYFRAPTADDVKSVYSRIGSALCKLGPAKVEIIPDVVPN